MGPLHHQVAATMVPLLAARPIASTADFRCFGSPPSLPLNHLLGKNRRTAGRIGEVGLGRPGSPIVWSPGELHSYSAYSGFCRSIAGRPSAVRWRAALALFSRSPDVLGATSTAPFPDFPSPRLKASSEACGIISGASRPNTRIYEKYASSNRAGGSRHTASSMWIGRSRLAGA